MARWQAWKNRFCTALFLGFVSVHAAAAPVVSITATPDPAVQGSALGLDVLITGVADLYAYQFTLSFNPSVLQFSSGSEGTFLATGGTTFFDGGTVDNTLGTVSLVFDSLIGSVPGANGSGILAHFNVNILQTGSSSLTFSDAIFLDSNLADLTVQLDNRSLQVVAVVPEPSVYLMLGLGLAGLAAWRRRQAA